MTWKQRHSIRLKGYDYSQSGVYFVTICAHNRQCLFGAVEDGDMYLNGAGEMVQAVWNEILRYYAGVETGAFVIMPNHVHAIVVLSGCCGCDRPAQGVDGQPQGVDGQPQGVDGQPQGVDGQPQGVAPTGSGMASLSLGDVVHRFKTMTTRCYADGVTKNGWARFEGRLWQRNYWEHIVRTEQELTRIGEYIRNNPSNWQSDTLHNSP